MNCNCLSALQNFGCHASGHEVLTICYLRTNGTDVVVLFISYMPTFLKNGEVSIICKLWYGGQSRKPFDQRHCKLYWS